METPKNPADNQNDFSLLQDYNPMYRTVLTSLNPEGDPWFYRYYAQKTEDSYIELDCRKEGDWVVGFAYSFLKYDVRPWFIVNGDTNIMSLIKYEGEDLEMLQKNPISIYMFEPLFLMNKSDSTYPWLPNRNEDFFSVELEWVEDFNRNHGGNLDITVYTCDYKISDEILKREKYNGITVKTHDLFLDHLIYCRSREKWPAPGRPNFKKKFISLNFRYEPVRELLVGFLRGKGYTNDAYTTFYHKHNREHLTKISGFSFESIEQWAAVENGIHQMQGDLPYYLEAEKPQAVDPITDDIPDLGNSNLRNEEQIKKYYQEAFMALVSETRFSMIAGCISEKTIHPMLHMRPFILVSCPLGLEYLKEMGFKTFSEFFDESYDQEKDNVKRIDKIFRLIDEIASLSLDETYELYERMKPVLRHNYDHCRKFYLPKRLSSIVAESNLAYKDFKAKRCN